MKTENELIRIAEQDSDDKVAESAMVELHERFHTSYGWCSECDFRVVKKADCCLNK